MITTDWREGINSRPRWLARALILTAGFLLRVFNLGAGIPYAVGIDDAGDHDDGRAHPQVG